MGNLGCGMHCANNIAHRPLTYANNHTKGQLASVAKQGRPV